MTESWINRKIQYGKNVIVTVISENENLIVIELEGGIKIHSTKQKLRDKLIEEK